MKLKQYFEIINPTYIYLKLTPTTSIRNQATDQIAKAVSNLYKSLSQIIYRHEKKVFYEPQSKIAYYIYLEQRKAEFYFIVPRTYLELIKEKIRNTWRSITITEVNTIPMFTNNATMYYLSYKKEDGLSLHVDKRANTLLSSNLNILPMLKEGDRAGIFYNFIPVSQIGWRAGYEKTIQKLKDGVPIDRNKQGASYIAKMLAYAIIYILEIVQSAVFGMVDTKKKEDNLSDLFFRSITSSQLSQQTITKKDSTVINTQILILSESKEKVRENNISISITENFKHISADNELISKKYKSKKDLNLLATFLPVESNKFSVDECHNLLQLPGRELLEEHNCIEKIDTFESEVPEELKQGVMCIGTNTYRGIKQPAYLTTDKDLRNLTLTLIGPTRAGKTKFIGNLSKNAIEHNETVIIFDYCGNTELSDEISGVIDPNKVLNVDCSDFENLQGLGYNEITPISHNKFEVYRCAKTKSSQLMTLINSINSDDGELKARMERYLEAAAVITFIQGGPIKDVFTVLHNHLLRSNYIKNIPNEQHENLEDYILALQELDEWSKGTKNNLPEIVGTKTSFVQGVLNRVSKLKQNTYMELMLKRDCSNNVDLVEEMQKSQLICIRMPEIMFSTEQEKDIYATYWLTKIWGALQKRKWKVKDEDKRVKVNIIFDELYQVPNCQEFLRSKLSQIAKFTCKPILSCHYLGQIGIIRNELKAANSSYILISGCDKDNYKELKDELYPYTLEDLLNLKRYHSLNLIKYEEGYAKFITKLPKPI